MQQEELQFNTKRNCEHCGGSDGLQQACHECGGRICFTCIPVEFAADLEFSCPRRCAATPCALPSCRRCGPRDMVRMLAIQNLHRQIAVAKNKFLRDNEPLPPSLPFAPSIPSWEDSLKGSI